MNLKDRLLGKGKVSRRVFLKGMGAAGATVTLYGCSGGSGGKTLLEDNSNLTPPKITESIIMGSTPHNCGGRCVSKYFVKDGVIKRIVTDERTDLDMSHGDDPQYRSCVRCRSRRQWFYRSDRLMYPLKQTKSRGDITGFVRVTWDVALTEIAAKMASIKTQYGSEAFHVQLSSGDYTPWARHSMYRLCNILGGHTPYYSSYSGPTLQHVGAFVDGPAISGCPGNARQDAQYSDNLVLWANNFHESIHGTNSSWYLQQLKEKGIPITAIDVRYSKTAASVASDFVSVVPGTDAALMMAMLYRIIKERYADIDTAFIQKYVYGFFDNGNTIAATHATVDASKFVVPNGGSLSAFILGSDNFLVTQGLNNAISIYPDTIGYNVTTDDALYGKKVHIWGQRAKTPEWAEKITGVPAAKIRALADMYLDTKVTTMIGYGYNRAIESEQPVWLGRILSAVTKQFGVSGRSFGYPSNNVSVSVPDHLLYQTYANGVSLKSKIYDSTRLSSPATYVPTSQQSAVNCFLIPDLVENGGYSGLKSKWNDGMVNKHTTPIKAFFSCGSNLCANGHNDVNYTSTIFKNKSKIDLLVNMDGYMTSSALLADYVLPSAMAGEKPGSTGIWGTGEAAVAINKIIDAPGESKYEYDIVATLADKLGKKTEFLGGYAEGLEGMNARFRDSWTAQNLSAKYGMTYDEWTTKGIASLAGTYTSYAIAHKAFRADPAVSPLGTPSGKFEAYCQNMTEDYEARYHENIDTVTSDAADNSGSKTLPNGGSIYTKYHGANTGRRFVYPIPMYIPEPEGRHAVDKINPMDELRHDDPLGLEAKGYTFTVASWHMQYRNHSTMNNNAYMDEVYKKDANGDPAYLNPGRTWSDGVWDDGVYEPVWINAADASALGIIDGNRVLLSNDRGKLYASAVVTERTPRYTVSMGQGAWSQFNASGIDVGGCISTIKSARPSRICKGCNAESDCRVKIVKA
ncbi:MAG: molybdopterin-dependent oxidoreductase [Geobacteraceae bacterium]|nr:molybdopterin-dependent oxidoreductase [Geobacteraceae bacterium]